MTIVRKCTVEGCEQPRVARKLCRKHYVRLTRTGSVEDPVVGNQLPCSIEDCKRSQVAKGLCVLHYGRMKRGIPPEGIPPVAVDPCEFEGCEMPTSAKGLCSGHYQQRCKGADWSEMSPLRGKVYTYELKEAGGRECTLCHEWRETEEFYRSSNNTQGSRQSRCKTCMRALANVAAYRRGQRKSIPKEAVRWLESIGAEVNL